MLRAMEVVERAGVPAVGIFGESFGPLAEMLAEQAGLPGERLAIYPGVMATESDEALRRTARATIADQVVQGLTGGSNAPTATGSAATGALFDVVFRGGLDEVQDHFEQRGWTDGLPIVPPTRERVDAFLRAGGRPPDEVLGVLPPEQREATVGSVAVHGVMAGCRPEHMPILLAVAECIADPVFRLEDAGSTPGWEPLVIVSGPMARALDFNSGTGAMRVGRRSNTTVGRFTRLYMRNVAGLRIPPGVTDQAGFGATFNVAMAEDDEAVVRLGWQPFRVDRGFDLADTVVTVQGVLNISSPIYTHGDDPAEHLHLISHYLNRAIAPNVAIPTLRRGGSHHILAMSPAIAQVFAAHGIGKAEIRRYLFEHTRTPAGFLEYVGRQATPFDLHELVAEGRLPADYAETADPERLIRVMLTEDALGIVVAGNPGRNQSRAYISNHVQGPPVSRKLPNSL